MELMEGWKRACKSLTKYETFSIQYIPYQWTSKVQYSSVTLQYYSQYRSPSHRRARAYPMASSTPQPLAHASKAWCNTTNGVEWRDGRCLVTSSPWGCVADSATSAGASQCVKSMSLSARDATMAKCARGHMSPSNEAPASSMRLFDIDVGMWTPWDLSAPTADAAMQCCSVCASMERCSHWLVFEHSRQVVARARPGARSPGYHGTVGKCMLYARKLSIHDTRANLAPSVPSTAAGPARTVAVEHTPVVLIRSDAHKFSLVSRCHTRYLGWLTRTVGDEATLELLLDASSLDEERRSAEISARSSSLQADTAEGRAAHRHRLTSRVRAALTLHLGIDAFVYTVEQVRVHVHVHVQEQEQVHVYTVEHAKTRRSRARAHAHAYMPSWCRAHGHAPAPARLHLAVGMPRREGHAPVRRRPAPPFQIWAAFPAVTHWPSPETHNKRHSYLGRDALLSWWRKVRIAVGSGR